MEDKILYVDDIVARTRVSKSTAYKLMSKINNLAKKDGFTRRIKGTTSLYYFNKYMGLKNEIKKG